ncbi:helix-turn-helix domain-containing protein [Microbacterium sp. H1-D42]|uniref:GlxA family transcriptional regulator n=1 Tax=Microbacterium sp. H1-D42 TaxID=2925844 RepID=UPI001F53CA52|nr:helix-turn-helix domain-containing protein [Microbacterium sp. H1-D42]UNK71110.1 helix-turn-helix domain-containing protein [Microbacterium sp. H1-D42]
MKTVACVIDEGFAPFEFGVACEVFGLDRSADGVPNFDFRVVAPQPGAVRSKLGFSVNVEHDLSFAHEADIVVFCPLPRESWAHIDARLIDLAVAAVTRDAWVVSVCSGVFVLAASGQLDGRRATTHWMYASTLAAMYPQIEVDPDVLFVQDGRIITSAGTAAGIDACLHLLRIELGAEMANRIAKRMVVPPQRDGGQAQYVDRPLLEVSSDSLSGVAGWAVQNLRDELTVEEMSAHALMSPRTFARRFKSEFGTTPASWLNRQRVIHAQRMLERTDLSLEQIAQECGFGSAAVLRQSFARVLDTTPTAYRARFTCAVPAEVA